MFFILLMTSLVSMASCADILAIVPQPAYSHQVAFYDLWGELSLRGHKVTVITTDPQRNERLTNLTEIDIKWTYKYVKNFRSKAAKSVNMWNFHSWLHDLSSLVSPAQLSDQQVQDLIHSKKHFDVLLLEAHYLEFLGFAEVHNCPTILISSLDVFVNIHKKMGNPAHPALNPALAAEFSPPLSFQERVTSTLYTLYLTIFYKYYNFPTKDKMLKEFFNVTSTMEKLLDKVDMIFCNVNPLIHSIRPIGPNTINIGGLRRMTTKSLPKELKQYLDSGTNGFIYFSLGSNIKSTDIKKESLRGIIEALGELPCKVLWKFEAEADAIPNKPENVKLIKWAPQLEILAHPNVKVFVTQGGLQSMEEAIHNEVPCVVIPFFSDQEQNAKLMERKGFATTVNGQPHIKKEDLKSAILKVLNNSKYKTAIKEIKRLSSDQPMSGLEKAVWWTEYVIRNKGAKHLRNPAADLPLYQYLLLDVISFLLAVTLITLSVLFILLKRIFRLLKTTISSTVSTSKKLQ